MKKVLIGLPSNGMIRIETAMSLMCMMAETPVQYQPFTPVSCYIHINREKCVQAALEQNVDYLLFVDADMSFPTNALNKLLALDKDIATVTYNFREYPRKSIVTLDALYDDEYQNVDENAVAPIPLSAIKNPFRVASAGTGFMLIKMEVFKKIPRPWFFFVPDSETENAVGEDIWFCNQARIQGFDIWVDPSIQMGHIGSVTF